MYELTKACITVIFIYSSIGISVFGQETQTRPDSLIRQLEEITIEAKSIKKKLEDSPFAVQVLDMRKEYSHSGDISNLLNHSLGVKTRADGSLGSSVQVNLAGLQGKAIKVFKDGLPIELYGHSFNLGTISSNMLERIEIYKGAMPVYLASDALGGGINLITRKPIKNSAVFSYELASYNTHRATANLFITHPDRTSAYTGINASFNYSDNNYPVHAPFYDVSTARQSYHTTKRFHDIARSSYGEWYAGLRNKHWADDLRLTLIYSDFYKQIQNDAEMVRVYGEAFSKENNYATLLSFRKVLFENRLQLHLNATYSHFNTRFVDTATVRYNWNGQVQSSNMPIGEINRGNDQRLEFHLYSTRLHAKYAIASQQYLELSNLQQYQHRKGTDPLGTISVLDQIDILGIPAVYRKNVLALAYNAQWLQKTVESIFSIKYYKYKTTGYTTDKYNFAWQSSKKGDLFGYLAAVKWNNDSFLLKLSYEFANRLPDEYEIFGDGVMLKENLDLKPEKSHNVNLNIQQRLLISKQQLDFTANLFYRRVKDIIFLQLDIPFNRYINYEEFNIKGVEVETRYSPNPHISGRFNLTYQDIRRINIRESMFRNLEGSRIPNIPYFFGNAFLSLSTANLYKKKDKAHFQWNLNYVHRFFFKAIPRNQEPSLFGPVQDFQTSLIIPRDGRTGQVANDLALTYDFSSKKTSISAECKNIANAKLYDNFNVQRQGRTFHLKLVYQII